MINFEHNIGDIVYLRTDPQQRARVVTGQIIRPNELVLYYLSYETNESLHYGFEIRNEPNTMFVMNGYFSETKVGE